MKPLPELHHHRVGVGGSVDADLFLKCPVISRIELSELIRLRGGYAAYRLPRNILRRGRPVIRGDHKDLLVVGHRCHRISVLPACKDDIRQHDLIDQRPDAVMDHHDVVFFQDPLKRIDSVPDRFLSRLPAGNDTAHLCNAILSGIGFQYVMPSVYADHQDIIDHRVALEAFQSIDENGFVIHIDKLFRYVLPHSPAGSSGYNNCCRHLVLFPMFSEI